jgi:two-component system, sensor histidine kinase and response regulator
MSPLFDYDGSLNRMGGDEQLFREMVGFLFADAPAWLAQIDEGLRQLDAVAVHRAAHSLKGLVSNFGAPLAVAAAAVLEDAARADATLLQAREAYPALAAAVAELKQALAPYQLPPDTAPP